MITVLTWLSLSGTILWQSFARSMCLGLLLVWWLAFSTFHQHLLVYSQLTRYVVHRFSLKLLLDEELWLIFICTGNQCSMKKVLLVLALFPGLSHFCSLVCVCVQINTRKRKSCLYALCISTQTKEQKQARPGNEASILLLSVFCC